LDVQSIGWIVTLAAAIDMAMFYPAGVIMDRFGRKYASVPSFLIQGIGMALVPLTFSFETLLMATLVIGFGNGIGSGTMLTLGSDLAPKESMGEFLGVWRLIGDAGGTAAPLAVGGVADLVGLAMSALVMGFVGLGAAALLLFFVPETLQRATVVAVKPSPGD
jgi:MFS family permease